MGSNEILQVISRRNSLGLSCSEEILHDGIGVVPKGDLDRAFKTVNISGFTY